MNKNVYASFIKDVHNLYCQTNCRDIERLFIRLAQSYEENLVKFLNSAESQSTVRGLLHNSELIDTFAVLAFIRSKHPNSFTISDASRIFVGDRKKSHYIPYILALYPFLGDPEVESLLRPFAHIIDGCQSFRMDIGNIVNVKEDLMAIRSAFENYVEKTQMPHATYPRKLTKKQKIINLFSFLLKQFTNEVSISAASLGLSDFSKKVSSDVLLARPDQLFANLQFGIYSPQMKDVGEKVAKEVLKNIDPEYKNYNYNLIRNTAMQYAGMMSKQDFSQFLLSQMNPQEFLKEEDEIKSTIKQDVEKFPFSPSQIINPSSLMVISFCLYYLYSKAR